jgi:hypothetical protein
MRKIAVIVLAFAAVGCCLSTETKILARRIAISTAAQEVEVTALLEKRQNTRDALSPEETKILKRAKKLSEATSGLADLLGAPEDKSNQVDGEDQ